MAAITGVNETDDDDVDETARKSMKNQPSSFGGEPALFTTALTSFGKRTRHDLAYFLELYIEMCVNVEQQPVPQLFYLLQSKEKKKLLKRIAQKNACIYLPGNDRACRRRITDRDLNVLCPFLVDCFSGHLTSIDLRFNVLADIAALCALLIKSPTVTELNLMFNSLTDYGVSSMRNALLRSKTLVSLCLSGTKLTSYGAVEVANLVRDLPTLRYLNLSYSELTVEAVIAIFIPLRSNDYKLEVLDLTSLYILDWTGRTVLIDHCARMLISNKHLIELHMAKIGLDDDELDRFLIGLRRNSTLRYLDLHGNKLNRDGARLLMELLMKNQTLEILDLDSNRFTDEGIEYLSNGIFESNTLKTISLRMCAFGNLGLRYLTVGISHGVLERLNIWQGISLTGDGCEAFGQLVWSGRIKQDNLDVRFYQVDGQWSMAEMGNGGLYKWDVYSPNFGAYSHQACYDGFAEPLPRAYWPSSA